MDKIYIIIYMDHFQGNMFMMLISQQDFQMDSMCQVLVFQMESMKLVISVLV